jgi:hypothetical protein
MSLKTIETALLTLGGSEKTGGSVGGLGKAKEILYFSWPKWEIHSKKNLIVGSGPQYEIQNIQQIDGTTSRIYVENRLLYVDSIIKDYLKLCSIHNNGIFVTYNGDTLNHHGIQYKEKIFTIDDLGDLYTVEDLPVNGRVIVQAHGLYMFSVHSVLDKCYVFNITRPSYDCLTSNRDSFVGEWQDKFSKMVGSVAIDSESTFIRKESIIQVNSLKHDFTDPVPGKLTENELETAKNFARLLDKTVNELTPDDILDLMAKNFLVQESVINRASGKQIQSVMQFVENIYYTKRFDECLTWYRNHYPEGFIIITDMEINSDLTSLLYAQSTIKLSWLWKEIIDEIVKLSGIQKRYGYGLLMTNDVSKRAEYRNGYLSFNPIVYDEMTWEESVFDMIFSAAEELTHMRGYEYHNESFKNAYTDLLNRALSNRTNVTDLVKLKSKAIKADLDGTSIK